LLVCLSESFARETLDELHKQLEVLPNKDVEEVSWTDNGKLYVADGRDEAIRLSDNYAPEHLEIHVEGTDYSVDRLRNYGSLFIGEETTVAYGDKSIGTNHILPIAPAKRD